MANSFLQVPPDSSGKRLHHRQHTVDGVVVHASAQHLVSGDNANNALSIDVRGAAQVRFTEGQGILSSYGALKTESERHIGVYESSLDSYDDLFHIDLTLGGTSTYDPVKSSTVLAVTTAAGSRVVRSTGRYHYYLPGSSNLARIAVACGDSGKAGNKRRWGLFDDNDGIFFELNGTAVQVVIRSSTSGTVVEQPIPRVAWTDKLDGTGLSGFTLDVTKVNNYWADYTFSGAGRVRFGVYGPAGERIVAYIIQTGNVSPYPSIRTATLPIRTENVNTTTTGSSSELREVVMTVSTEANISDYTFWRVADIENYNVTTTTNTHLVSFKSIDSINGKHNAVNAYPETLNVFVTGGAASITVWQNAAITSPSWVVGGTSSIVGSTAGTLDTSTARKLLTFFVPEGVTVLNLTRYFELNDEGISLFSPAAPAIWALTATKLSGATVTTSVALQYRELW